MSRYIDADVFKQILESRQNMYDENEDDMALNECACIIEVLDELPTADVVEVVRCKDCKFHFKLNENEYRCTRGIPFYTTCNDFCSYGERREEE